MALTGKQAIFAEEYLKCWNKTEAARRAGYDGNDATLSAIGYQNFKKLQIQEYIQQRIAENAMTADEVLMRLAEHARGEHGKYINTKPRLDMVAMAKDGKGDLILDAIDENGDIDVVRLALEGKLELYAPYILNGGYVDLAALEREGKMHLVKGIKNTKDGLVVEFYDAQAALVHIGKYHALFTEKTELSGKDGGPIEQSVKYDLGKLSVDELKAMREMASKMSNADT